MTKILTHAVVLAALLGASSGVQAESASELLEKAIYAEQTAGDLDKAIELYGKIIADEEANRKYVAQAHYRLGKCYLAKGDRGKAASEFRRVVSDFAQEGDVAGDAKKELARLGAAGGGEPVVLATEPATLSEDVSPDLEKITVTFSRPMMDKSWSWTGGRKQFPKTTGSPSYDDQKVTCTLPVSLEPGRVYQVGINSPSHRNFKTLDRVPARPYVILFATKGADGKPTKLPREMVKAAQDVNAGPPRVLQTSPVALSDDVSADLKEITVTFSCEMMDGSWSWTGGGDTYPKTTGKPSYDRRRTTCRLPVKLQPGKVYWVGVNSPSHKYFQTPGHVPAKWYVILFSTAKADGGSTPIPQDLRSRAEAINAKSR
ncbi:MAG: Ig-like domain-containing protein [Phycisphaerae bacterium]|nr:Ig-like domain-containing protein [Phycisphaerae bacterium]